MKRIHFENRSFTGLMTSYENLKERYAVVHLTKQEGKHGLFSGYFEVSLRATRKQTSRLRNVEKRIHAIM